MIRLRRRTVEAETQSLETLDRLRKEKTEAMDVAEDDFKAELRDVRAAAAALFYIAVVAGAVTSS